MKKIIVILFFIFSVHVFPFLIIGHRGACGYAPENTLVSFQRAMDFGVDMIELDVYVCATGELVVTHDNDVSVTTNGFGKVTDMTFQELRKLKVKNSGQIPTLQEVIDLVNKKVPINIELKGFGTAKSVAKLITKYLKNGWKATDFIVSSFDHTQISQFKKLCPQIKTGVLFHSWNMPKNIVSVACQCQAHFIGLDVKTVTQELVDQAHRANFLVYVWTVNDKITADRMRALGVDGIFSNYPDRVRHSL